MANAMEIIHDIINEVVDKLDVSIRDVQKVDVLLSGYQEWLSQEDPVSEEQKRSLKDRVLEHFIKIKSVGDTRALYLAKNIARETGNPYMTVFDYMSSLPAYSDMPAELPPNVKSAIDPYMKWLKSLREETLEHFESMKGGAAISDKDLRALKLVEDIAKETGNPHMAVFEYMSSLPGYSNILDNLPPDKNYFEQLKHLYEETLEHFESMKGGVLSVDVDMLHKITLECLDNCRR